MKKNSKSVPKIDPYLEGLMAKLLERLVGLERKMDTVISQTAGKPSSGNDAQPKPFQNPPPKPPTRQDRPLYEAICADCHKVCEVPFRPSEDRPVYCKTCFAARKSGGSSKPFPILTPVAIPVRNVNKSQDTAPVAGKPKKAKKITASKKGKKK